MDNHSIQFMAVFTLPDDMTDEFVSLIPQQRATVNRLMCEGKILNYALSLEDQQLWTVFTVESESELMELISTLPLTDFMDVRIHELTFYNAAQTFATSFSVN